MRKSLLSLIFSLVLLLFCSAGGWAQLETVFPFAQPQVQDYYLKSQVIPDPLDPLGPSSFIYEMYRQGERTLTRTEWVGGVLEMVHQDSWTPEPNLELFYANYELRITALKEAAGRQGIVIDLYRKEDQKRVHSYVIDQETGLILNQYFYDRAGNLTQSYEALEIDLQPDFSQLDWDNVPLISSEQLPLSEKEAQELLPWANLKALSLPKRFQVAGYSLNDYGEMRESLYLEKLYPHLPISSLWIWISDGYEVGIIEIAFAPEEKIHIGEDSVLEIVIHSSESTVAVFQDQPLSVKLWGEDFASAQIDALFKAVTGVDKIANPERLGLFFQPEPNDLPFSAVDYSALPQKPLSQEEFAELAPWAFLHPYSYPRNLEVVGFAQTEFPQALRQALGFGEAYSDTPLLELLILLSDGKRVHYVGLAFAEGYRGYPAPRHRSLKPLGRAVQVTSQDQPVALFSFSDFLSQKEQISVIQALAQKIFYGADYPPLYPTPQDE